MFVVQWLRVFWSTAMFYYLFGLPAYSPTAQFVLLDCRSTTIYVGKGGVASRQVLH